MDKELLRRVQLEQLEIAKEIKRVCDENNIKYFLDSGTLIGAVRHKGFIPWDDDMDLGMLREDYERFCEIAPQALKEQYAWQSWHNDKGYAHPFGKVRKKNTIYIEERGGNDIKEKGFYVDVFPFDYAPIEEKERKKLVKKRVFFARLLMMKSKYNLWIVNGRIDWPKRLGYLVYQFIAVFYSHRQLVDKYEQLVKSVAPSNSVYEQIGKKTTHYYDIEWLQDVKDAFFENIAFSIPEGTHERLTEEYGDYMQLPPEKQRENRHSIISIKFGDE